MEKLRVWHNPQFSLRNTLRVFYIDVDSLEEAEKIIKVLADYDLFQYENNIKPDYANISGLEVYDEEEKMWFEFIDENGLDINERLWSR